MKHLFKFFGLFVFTSWVHCAKVSFLVVVSIESGLKLLIVKMQQCEIIGETEFEMVNEEIEKYAPLCYFLLLAAYTFKRFRKVSDSHHEDFLSGHDENTHTTEGRQQIQNLQEQLQQLQVQQQHGFEQIQNLQENGHEYLQHSPQQFQLPVRASAEAFEFDPAHLEIVSPSPTRTHAHHSIPMTSMSSPEYHHLNQGEHVQPHHCHTASPSPTRTAHHSIPMTSISNPEYRHLNQGEHVQPHHCYTHSFAQMPVQRYCPEEGNLSQPQNLQPRQLKHAFLSPRSCGEDEKISIQPNKPVETPPSHGKDMSRFFNRENDPTFDILSTTGRDSPNIEDIDSDSTLSEDDSQSKRHQVNEQLRKNCKGERTIGMSGDKKRKAECIDEKDDGYFGCSEVDDESSTSTPSPRKKRRQSAETLM